MLFSLYNIFQLGVIFVFLFSLLKLLAGRGWQLATQGIGSENTSSTNNLIEINYAHCIAQAMHLHASVGVSVRHDAKW